MTVKELIEKLQSCNQDAEVVVYSSNDEGGNFANQVMTSEVAKGEDGLCFAADPPWNDDEDNFVVIL